MEILTFNPYVKRLFGAGSLMCSKCSSFNLKLDQRINRYCTRYKCANCGEGLVYNSNPGTDLRGDAATMKRLMQESLRETGIKTYQ